MAKALLQPSLKPVGSTKELHKIEKPIKQADLVIRSDVRQAEKLKKTVKKLKKNLKENPSLEAAWKPTLRMMKEDAKQVGKNANKGKHPNYMGKRNNPEWTGFA